MRKIRLPARLLALLLTAVLLLPATASAAFSDTSGHWAEAAIDKWSQEYSILQGYEDGAFHPDASITRGAFAVILDRFLQFRSISEPETFADTVGTWCESSVLRLHAANVMLGNKGKALIWSDITRQEAVTMIARAFRITGDGSALPYTDLEGFFDYAKEPVAAMTALGYLKDNSDGTAFRPREAITRAEIVNILNNMIGVLYQQSGSYSTSVSGTLMINAADGATLSNMTIYGNLIIAPGVTGTVTLNDVTIRGNIENLGEAEVVTNQSYITYEGKKVAILPGVEASTLTAQDFAWDDNGRLTCISDRFTTRFGIDVSAYQNRRSSTGTIDWKAVADDGVDFAMIRIALRGTSTGGLNPDAFYESNVDGALAAGIDTGVYIFSQAINVEEAIEEADYVISLLNGRKLTGPVAYDWEMKDSSYRVFGTDPAVATACALAFCQRIQEAGYEPMVYTSRYVGYFKFDLSQMTEIPIWYPEYKYTTTDSFRVFPGFYYQVDYWQYTDAASVNGIIGKVDANLQFLPK